MPIKKLTKGMKGVAGKGRGFFADFVDFMSKGHVFDVAVAFILSTAVSAVIRSLVEDIITPLFGLASNKNLDQMFVVLRCGQTSCSFNTVDEAQADRAVTWNWGRFINTVIYFIIITFILFLMIKLYYFISRKQLIPDKPCDYCTKDIPINAAKCSFCGTWLNHEVRRKYEDESYTRRMSATTLDAQTVLLNEKGTTEGAGIGEQNSMNPYDGRSFANSQQPTERAGVSSNSLNSGRVESTAPDLAAFDNETMTMSQAYQNPNSTHVNMPSSSVNTELYAYDSPIVRPVHHPYS